MSTRAEYNFADFGAAIYKKAHNVIAHNHIVQMKIYPESAKLSSKNSNATPTVMFIIKTHVKGRSSKPKGHIPEQKGHRNPLKSQISKNQASAVMAVSGVVSGY